MRYSVDPNTGELTLLKDVMIGATATQNGRMGYAPEPKAGEQNHYLSGGGIYKPLPVFRGVSGSIQSISGMVPQAHEGDESKVFKGNGQWGSINIINPSALEIQNFSNGTNWIEDDNKGYYNYYIKLNGDSYLINSVEKVQNALKFSSDSSFTLSVYTLSWDGIIEYTTDYGEHWSTWNGSQLSGDKDHPIYLRGIGNTIITNNRTAFVFNGKHCTGNIETLLDYQTVANGQHPTMGSYCYSSMFMDCVSLTTAPELPATTLAEGCYSDMFYNCPNLITAPELPATTLAPSCYSNMFRSCISLITPPHKLPATTLANSCYYSMFLGCTSLTIAPALLATTLAPSCYSNMFRDSSLITAPQLNASTLAESCYAGMFRSCKSLIIAPLLGAIRLASSCYREMFLGCTSLTTAPSLLATTLADSCYRKMFYGCTSLKLSTTQTGEYQYAYRIPRSSTGTDATNALTDMFVDTGGTFKSTPTINTTYYTYHQPIL